MKNTKLCYMRAHSLDQQYSRTRDAIRRFIIENGEKMENGMTFLSLGGVKYPPVVLTYFSVRGKHDLWEEGDCLALVATEDEVWFYVNDGVKEVSMDDAFVRNDDGELEFDYSYWYCLDWDADNSYQHNVERIAYYLGNNWDEDHPTHDADLLPYDMNGEAIAPDELAEDFHAATGCDPSIFNI